MSSSPSASRSLTVDVAIVNWNTAETACDAAVAFRDSVGATVAVTIVDNLSEPEDRRRLEERLPDGVELILNDANLGFGVAANIGLRGGEGEFICVSNADVLPEPDAIAVMARFCAEHPECGMVGPAFAADSAYHARLPSPGALALRPLIGGFRHRVVPSPGDGGSIEVEQPAGACFLVRRSVWEQVGGFDEGYFLWYEDVDLARRLLDRGLRNFVTGAALVHHMEGLATRSMSPADHQRARLDGLDRYLRRHHPRARVIAAPMLAVSRRLRARG